MVCNNAIKEQAWKKRKKNQVREIFLMSDNVMQNLVEITPMLNKCLLKGQSCWQNTVESYSLSLPQKEAQNDLTDCGWISATSPVYFSKVMSFVALTATFHTDFCTLSLGKGALLFSFLLLTHGFSSLNNKLIDKAKSKTKLKTGETSYCIPVSNIPSKTPPKKSFTMVTHFVLTPFPTEMQMTIAFMSTSALLF